MVDLTDEQITAALERGVQADRLEPRASAVLYNETSGRVEVSLRNGCTYAFPVSLIPDLADASQEDLREVCVAGTGTGIRFPKIDVDLSVHGLLMGLFGTRRWLARQAGSARSEAKARASRANGRKGGRPKKS